MKYLLDTNIRIDIINQRPPHVLARFRQETIGDVCVSSITAAGLAFGVAKGGSERNHRALEKFLAPLEIASFAEAASWCYGTLRADLERAGQPIGSLETLIAADTLTLRVTMVTNNVSEFARVKGLKV